MTVLDDSTTPVMPGMVDLHVCVSVLSWLKSLKCKIWISFVCTHLGHIEWGVLDGFNSACHPCHMRSHSPVSQCSNAGQMQTRKGTLWSTLAGRQGYKGQKGHGSGNKRGPECTRLHWRGRNDIQHCASWSWFSTDGQNSNYEYD